MFWLGLAIGSVLFLFIGYMLGGAIKMGKADDADRFEALIKKLSKENQELREKSERKEGIANGK